MTEWIAEVREVPAELESGFVHEVYPPARVTFATVEDQIDAVMRERLRDAFPLANGGTGEPAR